MTQRYCKDHCTYHPMSIQSLEVLRGYFESVVSLYASEYNAVKKEISEVKRAQQHFENALTALTEKCDRYKQLSNRVRIDAECSHVTL